MSGVIQPFPESGNLANNYDLSLPDLKRRLRSATGEVHSYVVRSVKLNRAKNLFSQTGSAPNFQGNCLTLCTCKHQMRASKPGDDWRGTWIAGFASRSLKHHWLFYLAQIADVCESQYDLWQLLSKKSSGVLEKKSSLNDRLGDLYRPKRVLHDNERFDPDCYDPPMLTHSHRQDKCHNGWRNDIRYRHAPRCRRYPLLLVGDGSCSFLWRKPTMRFKGFHARNSAKWEALADFLQLLAEPR